MFKLFLTIYVAQSEKDDMGTLSFKDGGKVRIPVYLTVHLPWFESYCLLNDVYVIFDEAIRLVLDKPLYCRKHNNYD